MRIYRRIYSLYYSVADVHIGGGGIDWFGRQPIWTVIIILQFTHPNILITILSCERIVLVVVGIGIYNIIYVIELKRVDTVSHYCIGRGK